MADSAVYAIKANVNISNSDIYNNDVFLSASTDSSVGIINSSIRDLVASGEVLQAVSSSIVMQGVSMLRIQYTLTTNTSTNGSSSV